MLRELRLRLRKLCIKLQTFNEIFTDVQKLDRAKIVVPELIVDSWIHLLMGLIYLSDYRTYDRGDRLLDIAQQLIHGGMAAMVRSLSNKSLLGNSVVLPLELLSLLSLKVLQDVTKDMPNITEIYSESLGEMVSL